MKKAKPPQAIQSSPGLFALLKPYYGLITALVVLTVVSNGLNLAVPAIIAKEVDAYTGGSLVFNHLIVEFFFIALGIFVFTYLQNIVQTLASERVAADLRRELSVRISGLENTSVEKITPAKLLTNLTSDVDAVKTFVSQAIASIISSLFLIIGASTLLLIMNWRLALTVLVIVPIIGITFFIIFGRVRKLFRRSQEAIDWLNKVISESILGAALIRLLNAHQYEYQKFIAANSEAKDIGMSILRLFATLIPVITFSTNLATLAILSLGGRFVIDGSMTLGDFIAFNSYLAILIFPIIILGFMSNVIAQATASYQRIREVLDAPVAHAGGDLKARLRGDIDVSHLTLAFGEKKILKDVSFSIRAGSRTAIIGPTAAGKTQLLYAMVGLVQPTSGDVSYDGTRISEYDPISFHEQVGFVFQDSLVFNLTLRENIAFSNTAKDADIEKAIATAELHDFIDALPTGLDTVISERGGSLSGGQKQRLMLARALALDPKVLLMDEFTARVDANTEQKILANLSRAYPGLTLVSITQKISSIERYDQIVLLMEGEVLAHGTHEELMRSSPEYVQIYDSQRSTMAIEHAD